MPMTNDVSSPNDELRALVPPVLIGTQEEVRTGWRRVLRQIIKADGEFVVSSPEECVDITNSDHPLMVQRPMQNARVRAVRTYRILDDLWDTLLMRSDNADRDYDWRVYTRFMDLHRGSAWLMLATLETQAFGARGIPKHIRRREAWLELRDILKWWPWLMKNKHRIPKMWTYLDITELGDDCPEDVRKAVLEGKSGAEDWDESMNPGWASSLGAKCRKMGVPDDVWICMSDAGGIHAYHRLMVEWVDRFAPTDQAGVESASDSEAKDS